MSINNHYDWLDENYKTFLKNVGVEESMLGYYKGDITAHGDKCYGYQSTWEEAGIPFEHGVAIYLLCRIDPWSKEVRDTRNSWVDPLKWVTENYLQFKDKLPKIPNYYEVNTFKTIENAEIKAIRWNGNNTEEVENFVGCKGTLEKGFIGEDGPKVEVLMFKSKALFVIKGEFFVSLENGTLISMRTRVLEQLFKI